MDLSKFRESIYQTVLDLSTEQGINASGSEGVYGCIFGRDSAITILKLLNVSKSKKAQEYFDTGKLFEICKRALINLTYLQGRQTNSHSGEEPGKFIHEYRTAGVISHIKEKKPWYIYPDGIFRNYDSLDSTPLTLIAFYNYWNITGDSEFLLTVLPSVEKGLNWIITYGDLDKDFLLEYAVPHNEPYHRLRIQSWTDSDESILQPNGILPSYPIAPVEVQGYAWLALKLWADFYKTPAKSFANKLSIHADYLKEQFNKLFLFKQFNMFYAAQILDGLKNQIQTVTGNPLLLLWATYINNGKKESIIDTEIIDDIVARSFMSDMFEEDAGIRTMSILSETFDPTTNSYHNGSFWPKLNGMAYEGLKNWSYDQQAEKLKDASLHPIFHFNTPIELYIKSTDGKFLQWQNATTGQLGCARQAWSAAAVLDFLTS